MKITEQMPKKCDLTKGQGTTSSEYTRPAQKFINNSIIM